MEAELRQQPKGLTAKLEGNCVIGRSPEADIQVFSSRVSREHLMIREQASGHWLYDLGSANGTLLNNRDIDQPMLLKHGDIIGMADIVFKFYVPEQAENAGELTESASPMATVIGVKRTPMVLLVTDIVDFSGLSEKLTEEELATVLNAWYEDCKTIMADCGGTIDKFMGDGMFGYWKATTPDTRLHALKAAQRLVPGPQLVSEEVQQLLTTKGISLRCGVGLHIGDTALGAVARGTKTALGDAVNIAFRIEALTRKLSRSVLVSDVFLRDWEEGKTYFDSCGAHELKGYSAATELFAMR